MGWLKGLFGLISLLNTLADWYKQWKLRKEVTEEVVSEVAKKEAEVARKVSEVVAEHRTDSDTAERLRDGKF